jgi:hypothetical protein
MLRRVEAEEPQRIDVAAPNAQRSEAVVAAAPEADDGSSLLPRDHPKWARDAVTLSQRAREIVARLRPVAVRILTFWDHRVRSAWIGGSRISIDPSGSYRVE